MRVKKKVPLPKALAIIVFSTLLISGSGYFCLRSWQKHQVKRALDPAYNLRYIQAKGDLPSHYIEELLGLSKEIQVSYYQFDEKEAEEHLLRYPTIAKAEVKKLFPQTLKVHIKVRKPIAKLHDFENTLVDEEGHLIPQHPLFSAQKLPQIYLGLQDFDQTIYQNEEFWQEQLSGEDFDLSLRFIKLLLNRDFSLSRVDLSNRQNLSLGKREIVLMLRNQDGTTHALRLPTKDWEKQLSNYLSMREECDFFGKDRVIDMRLPSLAYISE
ncbi:MAG: FtsQ-type POTRA domain-containing protein [Candidatus Algichlamydia australiensis]|nr:FtsQ-type POTRA domain-containing protein [Chlamydiales bacterium]